MDGISIVSFNVNGMKNRMKRKTFFSFFRKNKYDVICLQETHITKKEVNIWEKEWGGQIFYKTGSDKSKGEMILITKNFNGEAKLEQAEDRILTISVTKEKNTLIIANVYAPNNGRDKASFYQKLAEDMKKYEDNNLIVVGDFNCTIDPELDIISGYPHNKAESESFKEAFNQLGLLDLWRIQHPTEKDFTWSRRNPFIARRLDYCFVSEGILTYNASCKHSCMPNSDHKAIVLEISESNFTRGPGYWRFNNSYLKNETFAKLMNETIQNFKRTNEELESSLKWEMCKLEIRNTCIEFGKKSACQKRNELIVLNMKLKEIEKNISDNPQNEAALAEYYKLKQKMEVLHMYKTKGAQIRARLKWIEEGEKNTKFFCNLEKVRSKNNVIEKLTKETGEVITNQKDILEEQVSYYRHIYSQKTESTDIRESVQTFSEGESYRKLDIEEANACEGKVTLSETTSALRNMKNDSAPGSDGLTIEFYKFFWGKIGDLVTNSFNESFDKEELSYTQRQGVITLIHKGKDLERDKLNNWRPITLTNTDYKILAKALAERLGTVIGKLVSEDQVGFIKNRNISTVIRTIDDVVNYLNKTGKVGYLLALDYAKAFDSISKDYLLHIFETFGFGNEFQKWVKVLTNKSQSRINHGGWVSESFNIDCGIRQGCPFSPLAFVLAVELLAIKIRNSNITGIKVPSCEEERDTFVKIKQYADDTTLFLKHREDMKQALNIIKSFEAFSGLKLNINKTKALAVGTQPPEKNLPFAIVKKIKILGIYFEADKMAKNIEDNWKTRMEVIQNLIVKWSRRDLSIHGKIVVVKTFLVSQLIYVMQSIGVPEDALIKINTMLYKFVWQRKHSNRKAFEKVKRTTMEADYQYGGQKMINVNNLQKIFYLQWAGKLYMSDDKEQWSDIPKWHLNKILGNNGTFMLNCKAKDLRSLDNIQNNFWEDVIRTYLNNKEPLKAEDINSSNFRELPLFYNDLITYKRKVLYFPRWKIKGIEYVKDMIHPTEKRLLTHIEIERIIGQPNAEIIFQYNALRNAIPNMWIEWIQREDGLQQSIQAPQCEASFFNTKPKMIKEYLEKKENKPQSNISRHWKRKFDFELDENIWMLARAATKETRLLELQWKLNHNIYPTNILLQKMKVKETNKCDTCLGDVDFIEHFFFQCPKVSKLWENAEKNIAFQIGKKIKLSMTDVLFGVNNEEYTQNQKSIINHILLIGKMSISIAKKTHTLEALHIIFETNFKLREKFLSCHIKSN